jgi:hypothetical protein
MKHIRNKWFLVFAAFLSLLACDDDVPSVDIALQPDYRGILEAISQSGQSLSDKLALIEAAQRDGMADTEAALDLIRQAVASLTGTVGQKLAAIAEAVKSQATSLETKLVLIEAALSNGFADSAAARALLLEAIDSLGGTLEEKQAAVQAAIADGTTSLSARMGLIEAAVEKGFADVSSQQDLILTALDSTVGPLEEKLAAIESAVSSQTTGLETKLALIEAAIERLGNRLENLQFDLILQAISSLGGTLDEKLAAIESAVGGNATGLSSKLALIQTALAGGFTDEKTALGLIQTALGALKQQLGDADDGLSSAVDDVSAAIGNLSTNVNVDMSTALSGILAAVQGLPDYGAILTAIQQALADLKEAIIPFQLKYIGDPTLTMANGGEWHARFQVNPASADLSETMLKLDILSEKRFFPTWGNSNTPNSSLSDFYSIKLAADPSVAGQYTVSISCRFPYAVWDETTVALSAAYGSAQEPKYITSEPFNLAMMPKALRGLKYWTYPAASFQFKRRGSINNIYYSLDSGVFETQDESDARTYSAEYIDSVKFIPVNDSIAPVFIQLDKAKRMIVFIPDTAGITYTQYWPDKDPTDRGGWRLWHKFKDSSGVKHESLLGKLVLKDRWNVRDTIHNFKIGWYNSVFFPESGIVGVNEIRDDNTAVLDIRSLLSKLGLERAWLEGRFILQEQYGDLEGPYFKMSAQLLPETLKLAMKFQADPVPGAKFGLTAHYDLWTFPTETDPQFKILALSFSYSLVVTIVN